MNQEGVLIHNNDYIIRFPNGSLMYEGLIVKVQGL